jgi:hypothetical protein
MIEVCPSCLVVARAYHKAFLEVERRITSNFLLSFYDCFCFFLMMTPSEKAKWINAFTEHMDRNVFYYNTTDSLKVCLSY